MAGPSEQQLIGALRKADAAGDVAAAKAIARRIQAGRAAPKYDFSNVQTGSSTVEQQGDAIDATNARNREYMASPQRAIDQRSQADWQAKEKKRQFGELPAPVRMLIGAGSSVGNAALGAGQAMGLTDESDATAMRDNNRFMEGDFVAGAGRIGGDIALTAMPVAKLGKLAGVTRAAKYGTSALAGATVGALQPVAEGESRGVNTALGGTLGLAGQGASDALMKVGKSVANAIAPEVRAIYEAAKARGIQLTPAQLSDSRFLKFAQSQLASLPFSGAGARSGARRAEWNQALAKTVGEDARAVTPEVYASAKSRIGGEFNRLTERNHLALAPDVIDGLGAVEREAASFAPADVHRAVRAAIDEVLQKSDDGIVPGRAYQALDSKLGALMKGGGMSAHYLGQVRETLRAGMDRAVSGSDKAAWQQARSQYRALKTIRDIVPADGGDVSPAALAGRVRANGAGKESFASGRSGELGVLAQIGQRMKEPASSGTAERLGTMGVGAGAVTSLPLTLAALLGGRTAGSVLDSSTLARMMLRDGRGQGAQFLAPYLRPAAVAAVPLATPKSQKPKDSRKRP